MEINMIKVNGQVRKELGDLSELKDSIKMNGLLQRIVIDKDNNLITIFFWEKAKNEKRELFITKSNGYSPLKNEKSNIYFGLAFCIVSIFSFSGPNCADRFPGAICEQRLLWDS